MMNEPKRRGEHDKTRAETRTENVGVTADEECAMDIIIVRMERNTMNCCSEVTRVCGQAGEQGVGAKTAWRIAYVQVSGRMEERMMRRKGISRTEGETEQSETINRGSCGELG